MSGSPPSEVPQRPATEGSTLISLLARLGRLPADAVPTNVAEGGTDGTKSVPCPPPSSIHIWTYSDRRVNSRGGGISPARSGEDGAIEMDAAAYLEGCSAIDVLVATHRSMERRRPSSSVDVLARFFLRALLPDGQRRGRRGDPVGEVLDGLAKVAGSSRAPPDLRRTLAVEHILGSMKTAAAMTRIQLAHAAEKGRARAEEDGGAPPAGALEDLALVSASMLSYVTGLAGESMDDASSILDPVPPESLVGNVASVLRDVCGIWEADRIHFGQGWGRQAIKVPVLLQREIARASGALLNLAAVGGVDGKNGRNVGVLAVRTLESAVGIWEHAPSFFELRLKEDKNKVGVGGGGSACINVLLSAIGTYISQAAGGGGEKEDVLLIVSVIDILGTIVKLSSPLLLPGNVPPSEEEERVDPLIEWTASMSGIDGLVALAGGAAADGNGKDEKKNGDDDENDDNDIGALVQKIRTEQAQPYVPIPAAGTAALQVLTTLCCRTVRNRPSSSDDRHTGTRSTSVLYGTVVVESSMRRTLQNRYQWCRDGPQHKKLRPPRYEAVTATGEYVAACATRTARNDALRWALSDETVRSGWLALRSDGGWACAAAVLASVQTVLDGTPPRTKEDDAEEDYPGMGDAVRRKDALSLLDAIWVVNEEHWASDDEASSAEAVLLSLCQHPEDEVRFAAYGVLAAACRHTASRDRVVPQILLARSSKWGDTNINFVSVFLSDATIEPTMLGRKRRHAITTIVAAHKMVRQRAVPGVTAEVYNSIERVTKGGFNYVRNVRMDMMVE